MILGSIIAIFLFALVPVEHNYKLLIVQSGSMEPKVPLASLVMVLPTSDYAIGDIVTFAPQNSEKNTYVTHRIVGFAPDIYGLIYQTKGDANKTPDATAVNMEQIVGKVILTVPYVGYIFNQIKTPLGFIFVVIVPATIVIYEEIKNMYQLAIGGFKNRDKRKSKAEKFTSEDTQLLKFLSKEHHYDVPTASKVVITAPVRVGIHFGVLFLFIGVGFVFLQKTNSFFSDIEIGGGLLAAAASFPNPSGTPNPSPSIVPHIVINEVYYRADEAHGGPHPIDIDVSGNGAGSQNSVTLDTETNCEIQQENNTDVDIDLNINGSTGGNSGEDTTTGDIENSVTIAVSGGTNTASGCSNRKNHEWIELYNPTTETVNLKNWTITDNSGQSVKIQGNKILGAGKFALISKSNATWSFWDEPQDTLKIPLGRVIGDGLDDAGDRLLLKNPNGDLVDAVSYGTDTSVFILPGVVIGHSLERSIDGFDTDTAANWQDQHPPQPGI